MAPDSEPHSPRSGRAVAEFRTSPVRTRLTPCAETDWPPAHRLRRISHISDAKPLNLSLTHCECVRELNPAIAVAPESPWRSQPIGRRSGSPDSGRLVRFRRPPLNIAPSPRMRPDAESGDRKEFSRSPGRRNRLAVGPGRLILGTSAPLAQRPQRISYISGAPPLNAARSPVMRSVAGRRGRRDFSPAVDPGRLTLGPFDPPGRASFSPIFVNSGHPS